MAQEKAIVVPTFRGFRYAGQVLRVTCDDDSYTPKEWRKIKVIFILKPGQADYSLAKSFRQISLTSFFLTTLERMYNREIRDGVSHNPYIRINMHLFWGNLLSPLDWGKHFSWKTTKAYGFLEVSKGNMGKSWEFFQRFLSSSTLP